MKYFVSVINDGQAQAAGDNDSATAAEDSAIDAFNEKLQTNGNWVFGDGLADPSSATVIDNRGADAIITDGPFIESKEFLAGFWIIEAADLDEALALGTEASKACNRRIEVRPFDSLSA